MPDWLRSTLHSAAALTLALALCVALLYLLGFPPISVIRGLILQSFLEDDLSFSPARLATTLTRACPLILTGVAVCLAFRCNVLNIGAEGQYILGCLAVGWLGVTLAHWPQLFALPTILLAGALFGAAWALIAAVLKIYRHVPEVLTTILLNFVALHAVELAVLGPLRDPSFPAGATTERIAPVAQLPKISLPGNLTIHAGILVAIAMAILASVILHRTVFGFRVRAVGQNETAARVAGIAVKRYQLLTFALSGALAGLAGAMHIAGARYFLVKTPGSNYGFTAIAVALVARLEPATAIAAGLFFAILEVGAQNLQRAPGFEYFPVQIVYILQAIVIIVVLITTKR